MRGTLQQEENITVIKMVKMMMLNLFGKVLIPSK